MISWVDDLIFLTLSFHTPLSSSLKFKDYRNKKSVSNCGIRISFPEQGVTGTKVTDLPIPICSAIGVC